MLIQGFFVPLLYMTMLELSCRYSKTLDPVVQQELEDSLETQRLILGDNYNETIAKDNFLKSIGQKYEYGPFTFNLKDVVGFNAIDEEHTAIRFYNSMVYVFKINYEEFKIAYQEISGMLVRSVILEKIEDDK